VYYADQLLLLLAETALDCVPCDELVSGNEREDGEWSKERGIEVERGKRRW